MHEFEQIEDAIITSLTPLMAAGTVKTLAPYSGQLGEPDMRIMAGRFPALFVVCQGMDIVWAGAVSEQTIAVTLFVAARNLRGASEAARDAGAYNVLEAARALLHRKVVTAGWSAVRAVREAPVIYAPETGVCVYEATYTIKRKTL